MVDWLSYSNQQATRNQPLSSQLVDAMSFLPSMGVTMNVYSGGQPAAGQGNRVGSQRHDHGNAADVMFYQNGRMLDWNNPDDIPTLSNIVAQAKARGVTGIGAGDDYMGPGRVHIGFGAPAVWGAGGQSANAPDWLRAAYYGTQAPPTALDAINAAAPTNTPAASPSWWQNPGQYLSGAVSGLTTPVLATAAKPEVQQQMIGSMLGSVDGRTAILKTLMNRNVGAPPIMSAGHSGPGTRALAVNSQGTSPVTLNAAPGTSPSPGNNHMNMDVYRFNAAQLGPGNMNQGAINAALAGGRSLVKLATPVGGLSGTSWMDNNKGARDRPFENGRLYLNGLKSVG